MLGKHIALIYFYLISAASLALIVVGIFNSINFLINITQYDKYPLRYQEIRCESAPYYKGPVPVMDMPMPATPSSEVLDKQRQDCEAQLELDRKQQKLDDLKNAIAFTTIGAVLFLIHFPQARKMSKS